MNKYIDAEKLRALLVERYNTFQIGQHSPFRNGKVESLRETIELIDSLQQEQVVNKELGTLIACDIIEMTVKKAIDKPQDKEKEEKLMTRKINYLRSLEENYIQQVQQGGGFGKRS